MLLIRESTMSGVMTETRGPRALPDEVPNRTSPEAIAQVKFHVSLNVSDLPRSVAFYAALLGVTPAKVYADYAKFEIDTPPLVLSLKPKRACVGGPLNHLGLRLTSLGHLEEVLDRMRQVGARIGRQDDVKCCYAQQTKLWITDPDGTLWEVYVFHSDVPDWGEKHKKIKLWSAPLKAFGIRGMLRRWWRNAFGARHVGNQSAVDFDSPIPADACPTTKE
jgi:catechol 2,3-dioxygenase-like lactoylglutathione lyase family enzyme